MKKQNPVAKELRTSKVRKRVVEDKRKKIEKEYTANDLAEFTRDYGPKGKVT